MSFTPTKISEQLDGRDIQLATAEVMIEQETGIPATSGTFRTSVRPNPENQINVRNQEQLKIDLPGLIIPVNTSIIIIVDKSFDLDQPFIKQAGSSILIKSQTIKKKITYTGPGELIQMDGAVIGDTTQLDNVTLGGNFTNKCFAVVDSLFSISNTVVIEQFARIGTVTAGTLAIWNGTALISNLSGLTFLDTPTVNLRIAGNAELLPFPYTLMSFISTARMDVVIENSQHVTDTFPHELLFFDPNTDINSSFKVRDSGIISILPLALFQKGADVTVTAVADNGSGKLRCTAIAHGQVNNTYAVLSGFAESTYNRTALITVIDNDTFDAEEITFVPGVDSGNINRSSLDSTEPRVLAKDNPNQPDSMSLAESRSLVTPILSYIPAANIDTPIQDATPSPGDFIQDDSTERFTVDTSTGVIMYIGVEPIKGVITYEFAMSKTGGGTVIAEFFIKQNGVRVAKTLQSITLETIFQTINYTGGLITIMPGDTFKVFSNTSATNQLNFQLLKVLITRQ